MIAAVCVWHEHHAHASDHIERRLRRGDTMVVAAPTLIEAYAVLTRLPSPHRLSPAHALTLVEANFMSADGIVSLDANEYRTLLRDAPGRNIAGGKSYDAVVMECAWKARVAVLLTFNAGQFRALAKGGTDIVVPGQGST